MSNKKIKIDIEVGPVLIAIIIIAIIVCLVY